LPALVSAATKSLTVLNLYLTGPPNNAVTMLIIVRLWTYYLFLLEIAPNIELLAPHLINHLTCSISVWHFPAPPSNEQSIQPPPFLPRSFLPVVG
jgi:hypothetical protein